MNVTGASNGTIGAYNLTALALGNIGDKVDRVMSLLMDLIPNIGSGPVAGAAKIPCPYPFLPARTRGDLLALEEDLESESPSEPSSAFLGFVKFLKCVIASKNKKGDGVKAISLALDCIVCSYDLPILLCAEWYEDEQKVEKPPTTREEKLRTCPKRGILKLVSEREGTMPSARSFIVHFLSYQYRITRRTWS